MAFDQKAYNREYYLKNRAKAKAKATAYRADNAEKIRAYREATKERDKLRRLSKLHGISEAEVQALLETSECPICGVKLLDESLQINSLVIDHCHETGRVRGAICNSCNKMLGYARDNPQILSQAIKYLS